MQLRTAFAPLVCALSISPVLEAADLVVGPGGFPTLAAAVAAASPGDRILLRTDAFAWDLTISIPLTIESESTTRTLSVRNDFGGSPTGPLMIQAGVTLRNLRIEMLDLGDGGPVSDVGFTISAPGERVVLEDVSVDLDLPSGAFALMASISADSVCMRRTSFFAPNVFPTPLDFIGYTVVGTDCLDVSATTSIVLEDVSLVSSDAPDVGMFAPAPGPGGTALRASSPNTVLVRCGFRDGAGAQQTGSPGTSASGSSFFSPSTAYESTLSVQGGGAFDLGELQAPLFATGGQIGALYQTNASAPIAPEFAVAGYLLGTDLVNLPGGALGTLFTTPLISGVAPISFLIPPDVSLVGQFLVAQSILLMPLRLGNPSLVTVYL